MFCSKSKPHKLVQNPKHFVHASLLWHTSAVPSFAKVKGKKNEYYRRALE